MARKKGERRKEKGERRKEKGEGRPIPSGAKSSGAEGRGAKNNIMKATLSPYPESVSTNLPHNPFILFQNKETNPHKTPFSPSIIAFSSNFFELLSPC
jgi:hypothetical protein